MTEYEVVVSGYCSLDRVIKIDKDAEVNKTSLVINHDNTIPRFGGCNINVAVDLTRLGIKTLPIVRVGFDYEDSGFKAFLVKEKLDTHTITRVKNVATSTCYLIENPKLDHITLFYPGAMGSEYFTPYNDAWFKGAKAALITVGDLVDNLECVRLAKKHNVPLYLGMKMDSSAFPVSFLREVVKNLSGIFANEKEIRYILDALNLDSPESILRKYPNVAFIAVTKGSKGSQLTYRKNDTIESHTIGVVPVEKYGDSVGSGDGYIAGFLYAILRNYTYIEAMELGATLATFIIESEGATAGAPSLESLMSRQKKAFSKIKGDI